MTIKKNTSAVHVVNLAQYEKPTISEKRADEYVQYGNNNNYYDFLIEAYKNSTTNNAVINGIIRLIYGKGLTALDAAKKPNEYAQFMTIFAPDEVRKICSDLKMLGQCAMQVLYKNKRVVKIVHTPIQLLCPEKCDKEGEINNYWYSDNWSNIREYKPVSIPVFGSGSDREIMVIKPYSVGMKYFANVDYQGGLPYATLEEEISDYLINETQNSFSGTKVVNVNSGKYTEIQQKEISEKITAKLTGAKGKKVIVSFNDNIEASTTVEDISLNDAPKHYEYLATESRDKLLLSHNVTSPLLFGIITGTGFSSNSDELKSSLLIFDNLVIRNFQDLLIDSFDRILAVNEISLKLYFKTLNPFEIAIDTIEKESDAVEKVNTELSSVDFGEEIDENEWILIDSFKVDYDTDEDEDKYIKSLNEPVKLGIWNKVVNLVSTGTARPNIKSSQDGEIFKSRYVYTGGLSSDSRDFCKKMVSSNKVYRKEDIINMSIQNVNKGWGPEGVDNYDIWLYKGGGDCHHYWTRNIYLKKNDANSPLAEKYAPSEVRKRDNLNPLEVNDPKVYQKPKDMPYNGFLPTNKRFK